MSVALFEQFSKMSILSEILHLHNSYKRLDELFNILSALIISLFHQQTQTSCFLPEKLSITAVEAWGTVCSAKGIIHPYVTQPDNFSANPVSPFFFFFIKRRFSRSNTSPGCKFFDFCSACSPYSHWQ